MGTTKRQGFVLYHDIRKPLAILTDAQRGKLFLAILDYSELGIEPDFDDVALDLAFAFIRQTMDSCAERWEEIREKRAAAGSAGGRRRAENAKQMQANQANASKPSELELEPELELELEQKNKGTRSRFQRPTVEDVQEYCLQSGYRIDAQHFIDYYEANGWVQGKGKPIKDWRACVRTWASRDKKNKPADELRSSYDMMRGWAAS